MDIEEHLSCDICMDVYNGSIRCPRLLSCGHGFCSSCIQNLISKSPNCPTCSSPIKYLHFESIPIIYSLKNLAEEYMLANINNSVKNAMDIAKGSNIERFSRSQGKPFPFEEMCEKHKNLNELRCMTCSVWICDKCFSISHKHCRTLLAKTAIEELKKQENENMKMQINRITFSESEVSFVNDFYTHDLNKEEKELKACEEKMRNAPEKIRKLKQSIEKVENMKLLLASFRTTFEEQINVINNASCPKDFELITQETAEKVRNLAKTLESVKKTKETLLRLEEENKKQKLMNNKQEIIVLISTRENVFVCEKIKGLLLWAPLRIKERKLWIHCFQSDPPPPPLTSRCLSLQQCLSMFKGSEDFPRKIFIQFAHREGILGEVIIRMNGMATETSKAAINSCLGSKGLPSLKGMRMEKGPDGGLCSTSSLTYYPEVDVKQLVNTEWRRDWQGDDVAVRFLTENRVPKLQLVIDVNERAKESGWIPVGKLENGFGTCIQALRRLYSNFLVDLEIISCGWVVEFK